MQREFKTTEWLTSSRINSRTSKKIVRAGVLLSLVIILCGCSANRAISVYNGVSRPFNVERILDIQYADSERQSMDLYRPKRARKSSANGKPFTPRTIVFVYGGAWKGGEKEYYEFVASNLVRRGHTVLIPNYRLYPEFQYPDFINDVALAIAHYEQNLRPESDRGKGLVLMGHSAGAHTAAVLATNPKYFQAAAVQSPVSGLIALSGPYDLPMDDPEVMAVFSTLDDPVSVNPVKLIKNAAGVTPRPEHLGFETLLLHAEEDERVFFYHSERFTAALEAANMPVKFVNASGGHVKVLVGMAAPLGFINNTREEILALLNRLPAE